MKEITFFEFLKLLHFNNHTKLKEKINEATHFLEVNTIKY